MSRATDLGEAIIGLNVAEAEVVSIANSIKQVRHDHAVTLAGLEELLEQAEGDLAAAQEEAIKQAALFAGEMAVEHAEKKRAS
jgi:hypothetical protein